MHHVLIVDFTEYKNDIEKMLIRNNFQVTTCENAFDAMSKLKAYDFDLVISEVELPGDNSFDLYNYMTSNYPYIPTIMITDKNLDIFFESIFREGIGNVLCKPLRENELINLAGKLIVKKEIFGISNYLTDVSQLKRIRITTSRQIQKAISTLISDFVESGINIPNKMALNLVLNELAINAVYHSHGLTTEKELRQPVELKNDEVVEIHFGYNNEFFAISITDYNGRLTKMRILDSINNVITQENLLSEAVEKGKDISNMVSETGRGIDLVRKLAGEYYFIIKKDYRTEVILIFNRNPESLSDAPYSSLKIIEDLSE